VIQENTDERGWVEWYPKPKGCIALVVGPGGWQRGRKPRLVEHAANRGVTTLLISKRGKEDHVKTEGRKAGRTGCSTLLIVLKSRDKLQNNPLPSRGYTGEQTAKRAEASNTLQLDDIKGWQRRDKGYR